MILDGQDINVNELLAQLERENEPIDQGARIMPTDNQANENVDANPKPGLERDIFWGLSNK